MGTHDAIGNVARALLVLALTGAGTRADDAAFAEFLFQQGEEAARARDWAKAADHFRRAIENRSPYPEAAFALGEALEETGHLRDAMAAYRRCVAEVAASGEPPRAWRLLARRSERAIRDLARRFAELNRLDDRFVRDCLSLARRYREERPDIARRALEAARRVDPESTDVRELLAELPPPPEPAGEGTPPPEVAEAAETESPLQGTALITDAQLADWDPGLSTVWSVRDGTITGEAVGTSGELNWFDTREFEEDYTVRLRMRMVRDGGQRRTYGLIFGGDGRRHWWSVLVSRSDEVLLDRLVDGEWASVRTAIPRGFDPSEWHALEVESRRGNLFVRLDGEELMHVTIGGRTAFDGKLALFVQAATVEFGRLEVEE